MFAFSSLSSVHKHRYLCCSCCQHFTSALLLSHVSMFVQEEIEQGGSNGAAWGVASSSRALVSQSVLGRSWGAEILACFAASEIEMVA